MTDYRRARVPGATLFFPVNLAERNHNRLRVDRMDELRRACRAVKTEHPFRREAVVVLPDHLHCIWTLPEGDADYSLRWNLIKGAFSRAVEYGERISPSRVKRRERGLWQRRFWEHMIRDQTDFNQHVEYVHWNPVKHRWVDQVVDWPHSSFHDYVARGVYSAAWGHHGRFSLGEIE